MEDSLIELGITFMLKMLKDQKRLPKFRRAMLKLFRAIAMAYASDKEFLDSQTVFELKRD